MTERIRDPRVKDLTGQRFGKLVAIDVQPSGPGNRRGRLWRCSCDCGGEKVVEARRLTAANGPSSCGCARSEAAARSRIDITGARYGILTAKRFIETGNQGAVWEFKCDCGNVANIRLKDVRYGNTASCGCQKNANKSNGWKKHPPILDINRPWRKAEQVDDRWLHLVGERSPRMAVQ